jgi:hypothetical protein
MVIEVEIAPFSILKVVDKGNRNVETFSKALFIASPRRLEVSCKVDDI